MISGVVSGFWMLIRPISIPAATHYHHSMCVAVPEYFGVSDQDIGMVLTTGPSSKIGFNSMGTVVRPSRDNNNNRVVKFFSDEPISQQLLQSLFVDYTVLHTQEWDAYPQFSHPETLDSFVVSFNKL